MIIDCHAHYEPRILDAEGLVKKMNCAGVDKSVLIPLLTDPPETKKSDILIAIQRFMLNTELLWPIAASITKSMYKASGEWHIWYRKFSLGPQRFNIVEVPDNQSVAEVVSKYKGRLLGWIFINPSHDDSLEQIERWRNVQGMIGVKIHPFWHRYPIEMVQKVAQRTEELGLPMLVHLGFDSHGNYPWLIDMFPKLKIIFAHLGVPFYKKMWPSVSNNPNVFMDISSTYHVNEKLVRDAVKIIGAHKCLFGTDTPYAHEDSIFRIKRWVENLDVSDDDKEGIFSKNFLRLINL